MNKFIGRFIDKNKQIFRRKSFHIFKDTGMMANADIEKLDAFIKSVKPLNSEIKTKVCIVPESKTTCKRGGEYCILFYSEVKDEYLRNVGYMGEQIDLYLASENVETCLEDENLSFERTFFADRTDDSIEKTSVARYIYLSK